MNDLIRASMKYRGMAKDAANLAACFAASALILGVGAWALIAGEERGWSALSILLSLLSLAGAISWARECARCGRIADQMEADIGRRHYSTLD